MSNGVQERKQAGLASGSCELPEELRMLRDPVRQFMQKEVKPVEESLEHDAFKPPQDKPQALQDRWSSPCRDRPDSPGP